MGIAILALVLLFIAFTSARRAPQTPQIWRLSLGAASDICARRNALFGFSASAFIVLAVILKLSKQVSYAAIISALLEQPIPARGLLILPALIRAHARNARFELKWAILALAAPRKTIA